MEAAHFVSDNWTSIAPDKQGRSIYLPIDFSNGCALTASDEASLDPEVLIGLRLAYAFFAQDKHVINFTNFRDRITKSAPLSSFKIQHVLQAIRTELQLDTSAYLHVIVNFDEVQTIFAAEASFPLHNGKPLFKALVYVEKV